VLQHFNVKIFSHVIGSLKPDRKIYEAAIAASEKPPEALFFTDDREENIRAAESFGIRAHQFTTVPRLVAALRSHGVEVTETFA
jgi:HAD superfamily hydrolase (TIGR01509 family)